MFWPNWSKPCLMPLTRLPMKPTGSATIRLKVSPILRTMPTICRPIGPAISIAPSKMNSRTFLPTAIANATTRRTAGTEDADDLLDERDADGAGR